MSGAAVIGRQLRQQNTGRAVAAAAAGSSLTAASARARAPSHCNLIPAQQQQQQHHQQQQGQQAHAGGAAASQENKDESPASRWTWSCVWEACKALSGGIFLLALGTAMCVVGFFAEDLATSPVPRQGNASAPAAAAAAAAEGAPSGGAATTSDGGEATLVVDRNREYHLHNLSFAGPAIMGLGGIFIVAACVLTFEAKERPHHQRVVPVDEKRPSAAEVLIPVLAKTPQGTHLTVPAVWTTAGADPGPSEPPRTLVLPPAKNSTTSSRNTSAATTSKSSARGKRGSVAGSSGSHGSAAGYVSLPRTARTSLSSTTTFLLSPRYEEQFLPSPADLQIQDPDGCDTPADESLASVRIELYARYTRMASPRLFASVESDGLSDSDDDDAATPGAYAPAGVFEDQVVPLLGRCSPQDLVYLPPPPPSSRPTRDGGGSKRFPLLRQSNADGCSRGLNGRASADEGVPS